MSKVVAEMNGDELGEIIIKAVKRALFEHHQMIDERAKKADQIRQRLLTE